MQDVGSEMFNKWSPKESNARNLFMHEYQVSKDGVLSAGHWWHNVQDKDNRLVTWDMAAIVVGHATPYRAQSTKVIPFTRDGHRE